MHHSSFDTFHLVIVLYFSFYFLIYYPQFFYNCFLFLHTQHWNFYFKNIFQRQLCLNLANCSTRNFFLPVLRFEKIV